MNLTESEFQRQVTDLARMTGWRCNHTRRTIGKGNRWVTATSVTGWPDLFLYRPGEHMAVELKTDKGHLTSEQWAVLGDLAASGVETHVWRPSDWDEIQARLARQPA